MIKEPRIVYENSGFVVLDKPYGLTVNRSESTKNQNTLQDWIENKFQNPNSKIQIERDSDFSKRSGVVHRLDKDTSGLIIVAKNTTSFANLQKQFKDRVVEKTYLALVWGRLTQSGEVKAPITRNPYNRKRFGVFIGGKEAYTSYKIIKNGIVEQKEITLLEVKPTTGRTHQIRVHLNYINHPIVGDVLYSGRKQGIEGQRLFNRLMLHAYKITFINPVDGEKLELISDTPDEFRKIN